jgi:hypothetical protein
MIVEWGAALPLQQLIPSFRENFLAGAAISTELYETKSFFSWSRNFLLSM